MTGLTPERRAELRGLAESARPVIRYGGTGPAAVYVLADYQLGDRVTMTGTVIKRRTGRTSKRVDTTYQDAPVPVLRSTYPRGKARVDHYAVDGIVVGKRTIQPGSTVYHYDMPEWRPGPETYEVYLVAFALRRKPVMCRPDQLTPLEEGTHRAI